MRRWLLLFGLFYLAAPAHADAGCDGPRPRGPAGLPDVIWFKGSCGTFALGRDGTVEQVHPRAWAPRWAPGAQARADKRTYIAHPGRHLVLFRDGKILWRSRFAHGSDGVFIRREAIAFTVYDSPTPDVWMARLGAPERLAGPGEDLQGWARAGGFFTQRGLELRLRAPDGRLVRRLGKVRSSAYDSETNTLLAITTANVLIRTDGRKATTLADLRQLGGLARHPWLEALPDGLIRVSADTRMVLLRKNGTRFASSSLGETIVSSVVPLAAQRGVVFVTQNRRSGVVARRDRVLFLERGGRSARLLYEGQSVPPQCGYWANLSLRGNRLLYSPSQGRALIVLNTTGRSDPVDLWPVVSRTPGFRYRGWLRRAAWASAWNG